MKTRVLIAEPSEVIVAGLVAILSDVTRFKVLEPVTDLTSLEERIVASRPDVIIANPTMVESAAAVRGNRPIGVIALVYQYVERLKLKRFDAVIDIRESKAAIVETIIETTQAQPEQSNPSANNYELSKRETAVLVLVAKGLTNKEIADQLNVSPHTVMSHRKNIVNKTGIKSVAGLTVYAMLNNLIDESTLI
ncbi:MAG: response regulator transcription factor [Muribaculaceae bacterium]|nr:response regulator transcription factor [Muribaculaceae bacterium]